ncbi:MAG: uracil-DNA glycosylase [Candidatus Atribacteria bacterium]|nr:uracil-DNA glycosylase [Candidatus Atribacteria bacterium]
MGAKKEQLLKEIQAEVEKCTRCPLAEIEEINQCFPFLEAQIAIVNPSFLVTLGSISTTFLLETKESISKLRGQWQEWRGGKKILPMFHPSFLLRYNSRVRRSHRYLTWEDIQEVKRCYDLLKTNMDG